MPAIHSDIITFVNELLMNETSKFCIHPQRMRIHGNSKYILPFVVTRVNRAALHKL